MQTSIRKHVKIWEGVGALLLLLAIIIPAYSFAGQKPQLYVDANVSQSGNGTVSNPYKTIREALDNSRKNTQVHVANGFYKENITIPKNVSVFGESKDGVIITAKSNKRPTVLMKDESKIDKVTIRNGEDGIRVRKDAKVSISKSVVEYSKRDGITIESSDLKEKHKVSISDTTIRKNKRNGIFSQERRVVLMDNTFYKNGTNGVNFNATVSSWMKGNLFKENYVNGMSLVLDDADIWMKNNVFRNNKRNGIEVNAFGGFGTLDIKKTRFVGNDAAILRVAKANFSKKVWDGITVHSSVNHWDNDEFMPRVITRF